MNSLILSLHVITISAITLFALRFGKEVLTVWLCLLAIAMNLFVLKQINLFGLNVTASDALVVGYLLGLNLIQEYFGVQSARKCVWISFFAATSFLFLSQIHLFYLPNQFDLSQSHFQFLFQPMPRVILASFTSFLLVQFVDIAFFQFLRKKIGKKFLIGRATLALILSQAIDTVLFSYLGLYGLVASISSVILLSLCVKTVVIALSVPFILFTKKIIHYVQV